MTQRTAVEGVLRSEFGGTLGQRPIDPAEDLLVGGIIDSFGLVTLITSLEGTFGINIGEEDVVPENFQTLAQLTAFVDAKLAAAGGVAADRT
jgi:acyl carrier protein